MPHHEKSFLAPNFLPISPLNIKNICFFHMKIAVADKEINKELRVRTLVINFAHKKS